MRPPSAPFRTSLLLLAALSAAPLAARAEEPIAFADTQYEPVEWSGL